MKKIKFIDLFSGLGGFRIALEKLGAECVFSSEIDEYARKVYFNNFEEYPSGDITKIHCDTIPSHDILCAGFPCQPFSIGGLRKGFEDTRGTLFFEVARILKYKQPKFFILENVSGITSHDNGNTLFTILKTLEEIGYDTTSKVINTMDYGIPQNRKRWYCVGIRRDQNTNTLKDSNLFSIRNYKINLEDIIYQGTIDGFEITERAKENIKNNIQEEHTYNSEKILICNNIRPSKVSFRNDGILPCLTAKMGTGGNNVPVIWNYQRKLTVKECLKLMGFPDDYVIQDNYSQSYKQIGNSVSIQIIFDILKNLLEEVN